MLAQALCLLLPWPLCAFTQRASLAKCPCTGLPVHSFQVPGACGTVLLKMPPVALGP